MVTMTEETRKGPWTEEEDMQLVCTVRLLGDRRWNSIAQVSGLNRSGKSCHMRWVNYLHPSHKHGRLSPQEERLVIELHARWGNSWSRIARRLPGRTDNDIKNYRKTRMRTKAQEREMNMSSSPSSSSFSLTTYPSCLLDKREPVDAMRCAGTHDVNVSSWNTGSALESADGFPMDQIWSEMETVVHAPAALPQGIHQAIKKKCSTTPFCSPAITTAMWENDQCPDEVFWNMDAEEIRTLASQFVVNRERIS